MTPNQILVPLLPHELLRQHCCHEPNDTRYRAAARLAQSLWRERHGLLCGQARSAATGRTRPLGSRLAGCAAQAGANLVDPDLVPLVRRELAYREPGAVFDEERLWGNMLSSQTLAFSLFGPLKRSPALATAVLGRLFPDLVGVVTDIAFEHSPRRCDPAFTSDRTAFDVLVRCATPTGRRAFLAVEVKYTEAPGGCAAAPRPRYDELSRAAGVFLDADSLALRGGSLNQFWRQQLLATAMLRHGLYDAGRVVVIAPLPNRQCWGAIALYTAQLISSDPAERGFDAVALEHFVAVLAEVGEEPTAERLADRYLDFRPANTALEAALAR